MKHRYFNILFSLIVLSIFSLIDLGEPYTYIGISIGMLFMLFFPFVDSAWQKPDLSLNKVTFSVYLVFLLILILVVFNLQKWQLIVSSLLFAALPEEWFFRSYLLLRINQLLNKPWLANILTSIVFSLLHLPTQGWFGLSVFFPSLVFGWFYQKTNNLLLVIGLHALSNAAFYIYLKDLMN